MTHSTNRMAILKSAENVNSILLFPHKKKPIRFHRAQVVSMQNRSVYKQLCVLVNMKHINLLLIRLTFRFYSPKTHYKNEIIAIVKIYSVIKKPKRGENEKPEYENVNIEQGSTDQPIGSKLHNWLFVANVLVAINHWIICGLCCECVRVHLTCFYSNKANVYRTNTHASAKCLCCDIVKCKRLK